MPTVSLNMIVRNSAATIGRALDSVKDFVDEMIIIDTGSTDDTVAIATAKGAKVFPFEWIDNFAAARNAAIEHSKCDWILWLDDDEWIEPENLAQLKELQLDLSKAYLLSKLLHKGSILKLKRTNDIRLFPRRDDIRWRYPVHEQLHESIDDAGLSMVILTTAIQNDGYDPNHAEERASYYRKILKRALEETPDDPILAFNYARERRLSGDLEESVQFFRKSIGNLPDESRFMHAAIMEYVQVLIDTGRLTEAVDIVHEARQVYPDSLKLMDYQATFERFMGDPAAAEKLLLEILARSRKIDPETMMYHPVAVQVSATSRLADLYLSLGRTEEARKMWQETLKLAPDYGPALEGLKRTG